MKKRVLPNRKPEKTLRDAESVFFWLLSLGKGYKGYQKPNTEAK